MDGARDWTGSGDFRNLPTFPIHDLVECRDAFLARRGGVTNLAAIEINARLLAVRSGELKRGRGTAHAFELDDIGEMKIAEGSLEFFAIAAGRGRKQRLDEIDEVTVREGFF